MKKRIRRGVYETNSSSCHSLTMCMESDYERWQKDNLYLFMGSGYRYPENNRPEGGHFYTREEAIAFEKTNKYVNKNTDWDNAEVVDKLFYDDKFCDYDHFWDEYGRNYETFEETMITPNGEKVVSFGYYGYN